MCANIATYRCLTLIYPSPTAWWGEDIHRTFTDILPHQNSSPQILFSEINFFTCLKTLKFSRLLYFQWLLAKK